MNNLNKGYEWFRDWFDSPYYHLLYFHRDDRDARDFINVLLAHVNLNPGDSVLDLACGRGRHAIYLNSMGYRVTGLDLSPLNISIAKKAENERLHFKTHDMRRPLPESYDLIVNLFTSFGYFANQAEHLLALSNIYNALNDQGIFVLDYFNSEVVKANLITHNTEYIEGVSFDMFRRVNGPYIEKDILIRDGETVRFFQEKVRDFSMQELITLIESSGLIVSEIYGDYDLHSFDPKKSTRLIILCRK